MWPLLDDLVRLIYPVMGAITKHYELIHGGFALADADDPLVTLRLVTHQIILPSNMQVVDIVLHLSTILFATEQNRHIELVVVPVLLVFHQSYSHKMPSILEVRFPSTIHLR